MQDMGLLGIDSNPGNATERKRSAKAGRNEVSRAERYEIGTAVRYRCVGEREWSEGMTENISISGVLIRTNRFLDPSTTIEMKFFLPVELSGENAAEVICRGVIVRSSKCNPSSGDVAIASTIAQSRFLRHTDRNED